MVNTTKNSVPTSDSKLDINVWVGHITKDRPSAEQQAIIDACTLAARIHHTTTRASGEPYILHVITVADILANLGMDTDVLVAAILHEVVEDNEVTLEAIQVQFGTVVTRLVDGVAKMKFIEALNNHYPKGQEEEKQTEAFRKMLLVMVEDIRVVLIKLADRLDNMRTLRYLPESKQRRIARETLDIFSPLANRLGIWQIKWELEDLALRYLEPETYQHMARLLDERRVDREQYIENVVAVLQTALAKAGIQAEVSGRPKHIYSIWRKMQRKGLDFDQIFDVRAVRVLVSTVTACYTALGVIHNQWQPIPGKFDDYVANPKNNNYQSLHTTVAGPEGKIFEVQIRTPQMHHHAELGVASHWRYKEGQVQRDEDFEQKIAWLRQVLQWKDEGRELIDRFKSEIFGDRVYVLSPQGKVVDLPQGATPLDFAYYIHTQLGHCCRGARVNQRLVPLTYTLKSGEQVEILTSKEEKPSRDWLILDIGYLKTARARSKVRQWLKKQDIQKHINEGKALLERELRQINIKACNFEQLAHSLHFKSLGDFLAALGKGDMSITHVINLFNERVRPKKKFPPTTQDSRKSVGGVYIRGVGSLLTQMARCCNPIPNDTIIGYITKNRGVVVHRRDCSNVLRWCDEHNERLIEVEWHSLDKKTGLTYAVDVQIIAYDRSGLLRDISTIASNEKINILAANTFTDKSDNSVKMTFTLEINNLDQLRRALAKVNQLANVVRVWRKT